MMEGRPIIPPPVLRADKPAWWPSTVDAKIYAREERVVDWSSVGMLEEGLELRYGPRKDWQAMDDAEYPRCFGPMSGYPRVFRWGGPAAFYENRNKRGVQRVPKTTYLSARTKQRQEFIKHLRRNRITGRTKCERGWLQRGVVMRAFAEG